MGLKEKLNKWCFSCWVSFGYKIGWIKTSSDHPRGHSIIICNILIKKPLNRNRPDPSELSPPPFKLMREPKPPLKIKEKDIKIEPPTEDDLNFNKTDNSEV